VHFGDNSVWSRRVHIGNRKYDVIWGTNWRQMYNVTCIHIGNIKYEDMKDREYLHRVIESTYFHAYTSVLRY